MITVPGRVPNKPEVKYPGSVPARMRYGSWRISSELRGSPTRRPIFGSPPLTLHSYLRSIIQVPILNGIA